MGGQAGPGVDGQGPPLRPAGQADKEVAAIRIIREDGPPLEPPHHHVLEGPGAFKRAYWGANAS